MALMQCPSVLSAPTLMGHFYTLNAILRAPHTMRRVDVVLAVTEWVRVPVDTDSMSTINTGTFRGIGTQSSSITDRDDNEDYNPNFRKLKSK